MGMGLKTCGCCNNPDLCSADSGRYGYMGVGPIYFGDEQYGGDEDEAVNTLHDLTEPPYAITRPPFGFHSPETQAAPAYHVRPIRIGVDAYPFVVNAETYVDPVEFRFPPATLTHIKQVGDIELTAYLRARFFASCGKDYQAASAPEFDRSGGTPVGRWRAYRFLIDGQPRPVITTQQEIPYTIPPGLTRIASGSPGVQFGAYTDFEFTDTISNSLADLRDKRIGADVWATMGEVTQPMVDAQLEIVDDPVPPKTIVRYIQLDEFEWQYRDNAVQSREWVRSGLINVTGGLEYSPGIYVGKSLRLTSDTIYPVLTIDVDSLCVSETTTSLTTQIGNWKPLYGTQTIRVHHGDLWPSIAIGFTLNPFHPFPPAFASLLDYWWIHYAPENFEWDGRSDVDFIPWMLDRHSAVEQLYFARSPYNFVAPGPWPERITLQVL